MGSRRLALLFTLICAACGPYNTTARSAQAGAVLRMGMAEPSAIDPYTAFEANGQSVTKLLFEGLLTVDNATNDLRPALATSWEGNDDCSAWTFHLRDGTTFSNGEPVTAASFVRGMTRAADGRALSDVAYHMAGIVGYDALHGTEDKPTPTTDTFEGLSAPDPQTLEIALTEPDCEFDKKVFHPVFSPVPAEAAMPANEDRAFKDQPLGNGPFKMAGPWRHDRKIELVRNDAYHGLRPALDGVEITILPEAGGKGAEYRYFRVGRFDLAYVPTALVPQARATYGPGGGLVAVDTVTTQFLVPRVDKAPLDNPAARRAISAAIDRPAIMAGIFQGTQRAADSLVPPALRGSYQPGVCDACTHDPDRARALAREAGLAPGTRLTIHYEVDSDDAAVQAIGDQLKAVLGLRVELVPMPRNELFEDETGDAGEGLYLDSWSADYLTPDNFLFPMLGSESHDNTSRYSNAAFDDLIAEGRAALDPAERLEVQHRAEALGIGADMGLIPLRYDNAILAVNTKRFSGIGLDPFGSPTILTARPASKVGP